MQLRDAHVASPRPARHSEPRAPFLLMAHHRSGSNFLNDLLQSHPRIECLNEPLSMHTRYFRARDLEIWTEGDYDRALLHPSLAGDPDLHGFLAEFRSYLLARDAYLAAQPETERIRWFISTIADLRNKNLAAKRAAGQGPPGTETAGCLRIKDL